MLRHYGGGACRISGNDSLHEVSGGAGAGKERLKDTCKKGMVKKSAMPAVEFLKETGYTIDIH